MQPLGDRKQQQIYPNYHGKKFYGTDPNGVKMDLNINLSSDENYSN
jgi:hypothetical protein